MTEVAHPIDLNLPAKLRDREYRQGFLAQSSAQIAAQLIALRKRRDLNQQQVAELIHTHSPPFLASKKLIIRVGALAFCEKLRMVLTLAFAF